MSDAQRWLRVRDLFEQALDRDAGEVKEWLDREAAGDAGLAADVWSLLRHYSRAGSFLSQPIAERVAHLFDDDAGFDHGTVVGPYTIVREIGRGGMGRVYLATDTRLARTVALKALPPALTRDPTQRERLRREARAAAALTHPGICTIYALEEIDDQVFIAAEFVDGESIRAEIERAERPSPDVALSTARELSDALASAHARGITHRDLKPENVMRGRDGRVRILDFGLARVEGLDTGPEQTPRITQPGAVVGTPGYMAPEQLNGQPADARSDIFALGVLLYEYVSGTHPFEAQTSLALAARILESQPPALNGLRPDLAVGLVSAIDRCLRKAPADRFQMAADLASALTSATAMAPSVLEARVETGVATWWRMHQGIAMTLYFAASALAWQLKEWAGGFANIAFLVVAVAATVAGIFRGHMLFAERVNRSSFAGERRRADPVTLVADGLIGAVLALGGWTIASGRPLAGVLTIALGVGIALTRLVVEPATTRGAFGD